LFSKVLVGNEKTKEAAVPHWMLSSGQKNQTKTVTYAEKQQLLKKLEELNQALEKQKQITAIQEKRLLSRRQKLDEARNQLNVTRSAVNKLDTQASFIHLSFNYSSLLSFWFK
jgi:uncharacterized coiled-coil DUF342 family protein